MSSPRKDEYTLQFDDSGSYFDDEAPTPFGLGSDYSSLVSAEPSEDQNWLDDDLPLFGLDAFVAQGAASSVDPSTLPFSSLFYSPYSGPRTWTGIADATPGGALGRNLHAFLVDPPSGKALTTFQRSTEIGGFTSPWNGQASAGGSGSVSWDNPGGLSPPSAGTDVNGFSTRYFNASLSQFYDASVTLDNIVSNGGSSGWMLLAVNSFQFDLANPALNDPLLQDSGQYYGLSLAQAARGVAAGVSFWIASGGNIVGVDVAISATPGTLVLVQWRHTGTTLEIRNCSTGSPGPASWIVVTADPVSGHAVGNIDAGFTGQTLHLAKDFGGTQFGDFTMVDFGIENSALGYDELDSIALDVQNYYALTGLYLFGAPAVGAALNGYTSADFGGQTNRIGLQYCDGPNTPQRFLSDLIGDGSAVSFYLGFMLKARTAVADVGPSVRYSNATIFGDISSNIYVTFSDAGVSAGMYDTLTGFDDVTLACSTGAWHWVQVWYDGSTLHLQIDNGTPKTALSSGVPGSIADTWLRTYVTAMTAVVGGGGANGGAGPVFLDGEMHVALTMKGYPNVLQRAGVAIWAQNRYGVDLGFSSGVTATGSAAFSSLAAAIVAGLTFAATGNAAFSPLAAAGTAFETFTATGSAAASPLAATGSAAETFSATGSAAQSPLAASGTAAETFSATGSAAVSPLAGTGSALLTFSATGSAAASSLAGTGSAALTFAATGSAAASPLAGTGSALLTFTATGAAAASSLAATGTGTYTPLAITGTGSAAQSPLAAAGSAAETFAASGTAAASPLAATGSALETFAASGSAAASSLAATGSAALTFAATGSGACTPLAAAASGLETFASTGAAACSPLAASGTGTYTPLAISGTGSGACTPLAASGSALLTFAGTCSASTSPLAGTGSSLLTFTATGSAAASSLAATASALETFAASGSGAASPLAASGTAAETFAAAGSAAASTLAADGSGTYAPLAISGTGSGAFSPLAADGAGIYGNDIIGIGSGAFSPLAADGSGTNTPTFIGSGGADLGSLAAVGSSTIAFDATSASAALASLDASGSATQAVSASGSGSFSSVAAIGSGVYVPLPISGTGSAAFSTFDGLGFGSSQLLFSGSGGAELGSLAGNGVGSWRFIFPAIAGGGGSRGATLVPVRVASSALKHSASSPAGTARRDASRLGIEVKRPATSAPGKQAASSTKEPGRPVPGPKKR